MPKPDGTRSTPAAYSPPLSATPAVGAVFRASISEVSPVLRAVAWLTQRDPIVHVKALAGVASPGEYVMGVKAFASPAAPAPVPVSLIDGGSPCNQGGGFACALTLQRAAVLQRVAWGTTPSTGSRAKRLTQTWPASECHAAYRARLRYGRIRDRHMNSIPKANEPKYAAVALERIAGMGVEPRLVS